MSTADSTGSKSLNSFAAFQDLQLNSSDGSSKKYVCEASSNLTASKPMSAKKAIASMALKKDGKKRSSNTAKDIPDEIAAGYRTPEEGETRNQRKTHLQKIRRYWAK